MIVVRPIIDTTTLGSREDMQAELRPALRPEVCRGGGSRRVGGASQPYPGCKCQVAHAEPFRNGRLVRANRCCEVCNELVWTVHAVDELHAQGVAALARSCDTQHEEHWCPKYNTRIDSSWVDVKLGGREGSRSPVKVRLVYRPDSVLRRLIFLLGKAQPRPQATHAMLHFASARIAPHPLTNTPPQ